MISKLLHSVKIVPKRRATAIESSRKSGLNTLGFIASIRQETRAVRNASLGTSLPAKGRCCSLYSLPTHEPATIIRLQFLALAS